MIDLNHVVESLNSFFAIDDLPKDPSFSRFIPQSYTSIGMEWQELFEADFSERFNGLMVRGAHGVNTVFLASFPSALILEEFLRQGARGDLLFLHHPLDMRCGDPRGNWGEGVVPIPPHTIMAIREAGLSLYAMHAPLDYHPQISTSLALVKMLDGTVTGEFMPFGNGNAGVIANISPMSTADLIQYFLTALNLPYADVAGPMRERVERIAVVAGCGYHLPSMQQMESGGIDAYVTGEIRTRIEGEYGQEKFRKITAFAESSSMSLVGLSHAASEFAVMQTDMADWFKTRFGVRTTLLPEAIWWR